MRSNRRRKLSFTPPLSGKYKLIDCGVVPTWDKRVFTDKLQWVPINIVQPRLVLSNFKQWLYPPELVLEVVNVRTAGHPAGSPL